MWVGKAEDFAIGLGLQIVAHSDPQGAAPGVITVLMSSVWFKALNSLYENWMNNTARKAIPSIVIAVVQLIATFVMLSEMNTGKADTFTLQLIVIGKNKF